MSNLEKIEKYWDMRSEGFSKGINDELKTDYEKWNEKFDLLLKNATGKKVLDIGCGPGFFTVILGKKGYNVTAVDYSEYMLKEAEKNTLQRGVNAVFMQGDAQNLPFEEESFDIIVSRNLTWNLENPEKAYSLWFKLLKKGGILINCDGNHYRYFYNDEYMLEKTSKEHKDGHNPEYIKNIDVSIIDNIAKELPLSRYDRPKWDINLLIDLGAENIHTEITRQNFTDQNGKNHTVIKDFVLKAVK